MNDKPSGKARTRHDRIWDRFADHVILALAVLVLAVGTVVYRVIEDWTWVEAFYFSAVAVTTVGFGDLAPSSDGSRLFTVFYIFSGIVIFGLFINQRLRRQGQRLARMRGH